MIDSQHARNRIQRQGLEFSSVIMWCVAGGISGGQLKAGHVGMTRMRKARSDCQRDHPLIADLESANKLRARARRLIIRAGWQKAPIVIRPSKCAIIKGSSPC